MEESRAIKEFTAIFNKKPRMRKMLIIKKDEELLEYSKQYYSVIDKITERGIIKTDESPIHCCKNRGPRAFFFAYLSLSMELIALSTASIYICIAFSVAPVFDIPYFSQKAENFEASG